MLFLSSSVSVISISRHAFPAEKNKPLSGVETVFELLQESDLMKRDEVLLYISRRLYVHGIMGRSEEDTIHGKDFSLLRNGSDNMQNALSVLSGALLDSNTTVCQHLAMCCSINVKGSAEINVTTHIQSPVDIVFLLSCSRNL